MIRNFLLLGFGLFLFAQMVSCTVGEKLNKNMKPSQAQALIDESTRSAGLEELNKAIVEFTFRDRTYFYKRDGGMYEYKRVLIDTTGQEIIDILNNNGFTRMVDGEPLELTDRRKNAYSSSVNSVMYFAFLPYNLNDPAAMKTYVGKETIMGIEYEKVKVTFREDGGGNDFDDTFYYWFHPNSYNMDYLAYEYHTNEGGIRFRKAYNPRRINGVLIQDYENYQPKKGANIKLSDVAQMFVKGELELLSRIKLEDVKIQF